MSAGEMVTAARSVGFTGAGLVRAVAVSLAENPSSNPRAVNHNHNGTIDVGYWQINSVHGYTREQLYDPLFNASVAYHLSDGGKDWSAWTTAHNGRMQAAMPAARTIVGNASSTAEVTDAGFPTIPIPGGGLHGHIPTVPVPGGGLHAGKALTSWASGVAKFFSTITSAHFWWRIGEGFAALLLIGLGLVLVFRREVGSAVKERLPL